jgi:hypothetical protein
MRKMNIRWAEERRFLRFIYFLDYARLSVVSEMSYLDRPTGGGLSNLAFLRIDLVDFAEPTVWVHKNRNKLRGQLLRVGKFYYGVRLTSRGCCYHWYGWDRTSHI